MKLNLVVCILQYSVDHQIISSIQKLFSLELYSCVAILYVINLVSKSLLQCTLQSVWLHVHIV